MKPMEIEQASMAIIERELQVALDPEIKPIVKRVIHATADFSFAESMVFTPGVVPYARELLARGAMIVTDTQMALSGISKPALKKLGCQAVCFMADEDIAREAKARETTRSLSKDCTALFSTRERTTELSLVAKPRSQSFFSTV